MDGSILCRKAQPALAYALVSLAIAGCTGADTGGERSATYQETPAAVITAPGEGEIVPGPAVTVTLGVENITLRPAGTDEPNTGHLHLFLDRDLTPVGGVIPTEPGIVHLGKAQTEYTFEDLAPGEHVVIAVLGDYLHTFITGSKTDTVRITVGTGG